MEPVPTSIYTAGRESRAWHYAKIARPDHWIKNIFVLPGIAAALAFTWRSEPLWMVPVAIVSTCLIASANYTINEFLDAQSDQFHPVKHNRPGALGILDPRLVALQYALLVSGGNWLSATVNLPFLLSSVTLILMGLIYNARPVRTKDYAHLHVLSESINNPIRFLLGWFAITPHVLPPSSVLLAYWMGGAFLMATKRYSEYRRIGDPQRAALYRKSLSGYTEKSLLLSAFFYALCSAFFIGVFLIKYKVEFVLTFPLFAALFTWYLSIGLKQDSAAQIFRHIRCTAYSGRTAEALVSSELCQKRQLGPKQLTAGLRSIADMSVCHPAGGS